MSFITKPSAHHPSLKRNELGLTRRDYESSTISTLCAGCGHDSISAALVDACYAENIQAHRVVKLSGIGCSSKTPTYFLGASHGFNSVHGRMPTVATGANLANKDMLYLGVSGDGDSASIGMGHMVHVMRRRLNMIYIVENNGTYGLTKGQFSATNDKNSPSRYGVSNPMEAIDLAALAVTLRAGFVARSFSGDKEQLVPLLRAAIRYRGFSFIDVVSPCVTFNNHNASTKSFDFVREHAEAVNSVDLIPDRQPIHLRAEDGSVSNVQMHDGAQMSIKKLTKGSHDVTNAGEAMQAINDAKDAGDVATGLLYMDPQEYDLHDILATCHTPLNELKQEELIPNQAALDKINQVLR